ncbi:hypothetical protein C9E81_13330 [Paracoccus alkanivorans]|uniref:Uncharacterized protein n=1 Tax=Paracoccus alkanivorans TaxID=2116655 RepID=A0A3M0MUQ2_9RHOB|nr:hypothetical protein C9E81_13330 [Paracoccus alkanivorans]
MVWFSMGRCATDKGDAELGMRDRQKRSMHAIATEAVIGVEILYGHFPQRFDLIKAIIRHKVGACVDCASTAVKAREPGQGAGDVGSETCGTCQDQARFGPTLHSGDTACQSLLDYVFICLAPAANSSLPKTALQFVFPSTRHPF